LHEGKAVALGRGAFLPIDDGSGELDAARRTACQQRRQVGGTGDAQPLQAALVGRQRM